MISNNWNDFIVALDDDAYHQGLDVTVGTYDISSGMVEGVTGVAKAVKKIVEQQQTIPTIAIRFLYLRRGIEIEQQGMRMTSKAPSASAIVKRDFGVKKGLSKRKTGEIFEVLLTLAQWALNDIESFEIWYYNRVSSEVV